MELTDVVLYNIVKGLHMILKGFISRIPKACYIDNGSVWVGIPDLSAQKKAVVFGVFRIHIQKIDISFLFHLF